MLLVLITIGSVIFASAQIQFGVKAGVNLSNLKLSGGPSGITFSTRTDFCGGVLVSVPLFKSFSLQPEIVYSSQGASFNDSNVNVKINYGYVNVPALFKYQHSSGLFAETGPQIGFLLSANDKINGETSDAKNSTQTIDFSWIFGIGYRLPLGLGIDARYNLGLTNISKNSAVDGTVKNSVFQFGIFFLFPK
jgi:hypothetical protein